MNIYIFLSSFEVSLEIKKSLASQDRNVIRVKKKGGGENRWSKMVLAKW